MFRTRSVIVVLIIYVYFSFFIFSNAGKKRGFKVILKNAQMCKHPCPPYVKKINVMSKFKVDIVNGTRYLSGNTTITAPVRFLNFSGRSFAVDSSGKRVVKFQISQVSCRNIFVRTIMRMTNITYTTRTCMLHKGFFRYDNMDLNKIMHALPGWHAPGDIIHELQLVSDGATEFCSEILVTIVDY